MSANDPGVEIETVPANANAAATPRKKSRRFETVTSIPFDSRGNTVNNGDHNYCDTILHRRDRRKNDRDEERTLQRDQEEFHQGKP